MCDRRLYGHRLEISVILSLALLVLALNHTAAAQTLDDDSGDASSITSSMQGGQQDYLKVISNSEGHLQTLQIPTSQMLFDVKPIYDNQGNQVSLSLALKPELGDFYHQVGLFDKPKDIVFIYPSFTQAAYGHNGFYDYYRKQCDSSCLTVPIPNHVNGIQASSIVSAWILKLLGYPYLMDQDVDKNPDVLKQYKRVIVLHSEYVTQKEFDAITNHPDVIFLYPNALYARVTANYDNNTITLVRGHGYPDISIRNGFDWKGDNTKYEYDVQCNNWNFYSRENHTMLNCYPEYTILTSSTMLELLQKGDPTSLLDDAANYLMYPQDKNATENLLEDFDVPGNTLPTWVQKPVLWISNGEISRTELGDLLRYLSQNNIIK